MDKIKTTIGFLMMLSAFIVSEKAAVFIVYIFAAAIHEAGHLIAAKALKIKIKGIGFDYSGLRIHIDEKMTAYTSEIVLAAAGPIFNALSAGVGYFILKNHFVDSGYFFEEVTKFISAGEPSPIGSSGFFIVASCVQAAINLLPIKTFDGGRMLYCMLATIYEEETAEKVLSFTSSVFAFILWIVSLYLMLKLSRGLGIYIFATSIFAISLKDKNRYDHKENIKIKAKFH